MRWLWCLFGGHSHHVLDVTYAPPIGKLSHMPDFFHDRGRWELEKTVHGVTTFLLKCDKCGDVQRKECLGQQTSMRQLERDQVHG